MHRMPFFSAMTYLPTVALFYILFFFLQLVCSFLSFILDTFSDTQVRANVQVATTPACTKRYLGIVFCCTGYYKKKSRDRKF